MTAKIIFGWDTAIWKSGIWGCKTTLNIEKIAVKVVQMKILAMHITDQKLSFNIFTVGNLLNIFMEHGFWNKWKIYDFDPYNILLTIATNIPVLLMTSVVVQGHKSDWKNVGLNSVWLSFLWQAGVRNKKLPLCTAVFQLLHMHYQPSESEFCIFIQLVYSLEFFALKHKNIMLVWTENKNKAQPVRSDSQMNSSRADFFMYIYFFFISLNLLCLNVE